MKLYLFGWANAHNGHADIKSLLKLIEQTIRQTWVKQVFHIPFARTIATEPERDGDRFNRNIYIDGLEYLNANNPEDIKKANNPLIFLSGGGKSLNLLQKLQENPELISLIKNAKHIIGESAWSMVLCTYMRIAGENKPIKALDIIKNTIIEPHYSQKKRQELLIKETKEIGIKYGIGIDENTGIMFDIDTFPHEWKKIGDGEIEIKENNQ